MELTFSAMLILKHLARCNSDQRLIRFNVVADSVCVSRMTVRRRIDELKRTGMIRVDRPGLGWAYDIDVTPEGRKVLDQWLQ
jgi:DNA-binding Lrp family transcriptional regulator